jgi:hypothetical protein
VLKVTDKLTTRCSRQPVNSRRQRTGNGATLDERALREPSLRQSVPSS